MTAPRRHSPRPDWPTKPLCQQSARLGGDLAIAQNANNVTCRRCLDHMAGVSQPRPRGLAAYPEQKRHWPHRVHAGQAHCMSRPGVHDKLVFAAHPGQITCKRCLTKARAL